MNKRITTALAGGLATLAIGIAPAKAQDELTLCWAAWDPANALVELSKDFTAETGIGMKFEFVPWDELRRSVPQRAELRRQALRPADRRQPVDRRLRGERPLREAQRFLRRRRDLHGRLPAGDRLRLLDLAEGHAQLLGAAGHGRRRSDGSTARTGSSVPSCRPSSRRSTAATSRRRRPGPSFARSASSSRNGRSTGRRSTARRSTPSAAPRGSPWA